MRRVPKEAGRSAHLVGDDETSLARTLDLEHFHDRAIAAFDLPEYPLVDLEGVFAGLFEEDRIRHRADIGETIGARRRGTLCGEMALCDKVTAELLGGSRGNRTGRTEGFETETVGWGRLVEEKGVDSRD